MVNYKRVVCEVAVLLVVVSVTTAAPVADCKHDDHHDHYDQRQNGTENYRWNIDGLVIAVAPEESLFGDIPSINDLFDLTSIDGLPKPSTENSPTKPEESLKPDIVKPLSDVSLNSDVTDHKKEKKDASISKQEKARRLKHHLANAILPLLRKLRHQ